MERQAGPEVCKSRRLLTGRDAAVSKAARHYSATLHFVTQVKYKFSDTESNIKLGMGNRKYGINPSLQGSHFGGQKRGGVG